MKKMILLAVIAYVLSACNQEIDSGSYAMIVVVNNTEYNGTEANLNDFETKGVIGEITKRVPAKVFPNNNQSNFFEEGSIIYSVKTDPSFIIVEDPEGEQYLLQQSPGET
ncbi:membrane lipoprotein lipid attachment site-containing protein [Planococcus sp. FY231025]|uniref:membrane lipoprotein lipid attachment site-containing protein n=1 Tax=Planococcus sp. FY231025 TaxID=3455699 RepID=UPI003F8FB2A0